MSVLGNDILVGLPQNIRMLHIAQLEEFTPGTTILQELLGTDTNRTRIIKEAQGWFSSYYLSNINFPLSLSVTGVHIKIDLRFSTQRGRP